MQTVNSKQKFVSPIQHTAPRTQTKRRKIDAATIWVSLAALTIILPLLTISAVTIFFQTRQINLPGVMVFDKDVSMLTLEETAGLVDQFWNQDSHIQITSSDDPDINFWVTPEELGLWVDPQETAKAAYAVGRRSDPFEDIVSAINGQTQVVLPVLNYNETQAQMTLEAIAKDLNIPHTNAYVTFSHDAWVAVPGQSGRSLMIQPTLEELNKNAFLILLLKSLNLHFQPEQPELKDLSPILDEIESIVAKELSLEAYDPIIDETYRWQVPLDVKRSWIDVDPETFHIFLNFKQDSIADLIHTWEGDLRDGRSLEISSNLDVLIEKWRDNQTVETIIRHPTTKYQVGPGESLWGISLKLGMPMWYILEANEGLSANALQAGMNLTIPSKSDLLPLPVIRNKRIVIDISEQRMRVYENGQIRNTHIISTGVADSPTMVGVFQVQTHEINAYASNWDLYMPHFMGIYEAWPGFMNGIHGLPLLSNGQRMWASSLGRPVSYGCIILDLSAAEDLYHWAEKGVVVEIIR